MRAKVVLFMLVAVLLAGNAWAGTIFVDAANTSGIENGTLEYPFDTIKEGINAVVAGDIVSVAPGIYHGAIELKHDVKVISQQGPEVTRIDGMGSSPGVRQAYA